MATDLRTEKKADQQSVAPSRRIVTRPGLPTGRAVVGALLVTLSVVGLFLAYQNATAGPSTSFVVMTGTVTPGSRLTAGDVALRPMELTEDVAAFTLTRMDQAVGAVALQNLQPGQLVQGDDVLLAAEGETPETAASFEFSIAIDRTRSLAGSLKTGEIVDLVATFGNQVGCTVVVADNARIVRIERRDDDLLGSTGAQTLTLALTDPAGLLQAIYASDEAQLTVVRSSTAGDLDLTGSFCVADLTIADVSG